MGLADDVIETFAVLKNTTVRFVKIWMGSWIAYVLGSLAWIGVDMIDYAWALLLPAFATAAAALYYLSETAEESDPSFINRRAPYYGYYGRPGERMDHPSRSDDPRDRPVSTYGANRYNSSATAASRYRPGVGATGTSSSYRSTSTYDVSPQPTSRYGGGVAHSPRPAAQQQGSGGVMGMRNNYSGITTILKNVIYPGTSNRAVLSEALAEMDRAEEDCNNQRRAPGTATLPPHYLLLVKDDDLTQLRGIFKYMGDNCLRRVWGSFPNETLTIEEIEQHRAPDGQPSRQFKYQPNTKYFDELPTCEGVFNEFADAFTMPKLQVSNRPVTRPTSRPPLASSNPNSAAGYGPARTTFTPKSNFTTSSASTGARMGPGGKTAPYSSAYSSTYSSSSGAGGGYGSSGGLYSSGGSAYGGGGSAYGGSSYSSPSYSSSYNKSSSYNSFDERPVGGGSRMQQESTRVNDDPYARPASNLRRKGELVEVSW